MMVELISAIGELCRHLDAKKNGIMIDDGWQCFWAEMTEELEGRLLTYWWLAMNTPTRTTKGCARTPGRATSR